MRYGKVLITGGLGFIGRHVADLVAGQGREVMLFDNLSSQVHGAVPEIREQALLRRHGIEVCRGDVRFPADWEKVLPGVQQVVHLAAETGTAQSMYEISRFTETNVAGTAGLLNYLANHKHQVEKIILASSRSVYGEGAYNCEQCGLVYPAMRTEPMLRAGEWDPRCAGCYGSIVPAATPEDARLAPSSIYAATKLAQEQLVRIATEALGIPALILRMQNVYGEGQSLRNPYTGILSIFSNQLCLGKTLNLYEDGQESRDFVHVSDAARAIVLGLTSQATDGKTLNVGSGCATTIEQVVLMLCEHLEIEAHYEISGEYRLGDIRHALADLTAIQSYLGFEPVMSLQRGLACFAEWVKTQPLEQDQLARATQELVGRGLMPSRVTASGRGMASD